MELNYDEEMSKAQLFIDDILSVYKKHNKSITHEDHGGALLISELNEENEEWLKYSLDWFSYDLKNPKEEERPLRKVVFKDDETNEEMDLLAIVGVSDNLTAGVVGKKDGSKEYVNLDQVRVIG